MEYEFTTYDQNLILSLFFIGFISKIPMVPLHLWLPEAHVEASTIGSVLLAAIVLKLGFYGLYRIFELICLFNLPTMFKKVFIIFSLNSIIYASFLVVRQVDLKKIVAYSSIIHMNSGILGLCGISIIGNEGSIFVMFSHGLISAGMFFLIGMLYDRFHIRNYMYYSGLIQYMPILGILMCIIFLANMSLPGTCNFVGEFLIFTSIYININIPVLKLVVSLSFFTTLFCMIVINKILFYQITGLLSINLRDVDKNELQILSVLGFLILILGIGPNAILNLL